MFLARCEVDGGVRAPSESKGVSHFCCQISTGQSARGRVECSLMRIEKDDDLGLVDRKEQRRDEDADREIALENMRVRAEFTTQGIRGLLLINGGGAAALLAFLQAIWEDEPALAEYVVTAIAWLAFGVVVAGLAFFLRYHTSLAISNRLERLRVNC